MDPYVDRLMRRAEKLQQDAIHTDARSRKTQSRVEQTHKDLHHELQVCGRRLLELSEDTSTTAERVKNVLKKFQQVVKHGDLDHLKSKVTRWAPEKKVSREMFKRMHELS